MSTFDALYDKLAGGTVGNWLAIVGLLSLIYWGWLIVAAWQSRTASRTAATPVAAASAAPPPAPVPAAAAVMPPGDIAVIAAAVHAMLGSGHVIHLDPADSGQNWENEGRWIQQTSHKIR